MNVLQGSNAWCRYNPSNSFDEYLRTLECLYDVSVQIIHIPVRGNIRVDWLSLALIERSVQLLVYSLNPVLLNLTNRRGSSMLDIVIPPN